MFTPDEIESIPIALEQLFSNLQLNIMSDLVRRISNMQDVSSASDWQINRLYELGMSKKEIQSFVQNTLDKSDKEIEKVFFDVIESGYARDESLYKTVGKDFIPYEKNKPLQQLVKAVKTQTKDECKNITQSMGFAVKQPDGTLKFQPIAEYYQKTLDNASMDIVSGAFDYNTVLKRTVNEMTNSGLRSVDYASGWSNRVPVAARRAVMTGFNQVVAKVNEDNAKALDTEYFEVSYHGGARPTHQVWQGKVYSKEELKSICGLGSVTGLCGANCYHSYSPFVKGASERIYTDEQLEKMNAEENTPKQYGDKSYTTYEALQRQRKLETTMRAQREKIKLLQDGGADEQDTLNAKAKYFGTSNEYAEFSKAMNLPQQRERVNIDGIGTVKSSKSVAKSDDSGIIELKNKSAKTNRFPTTQENIDRLIDEDMSGIKFTKRPQYNSRIRDNGKTTIREFSDGSVKEIVKVEIGKQDKSSAEFLEDTILHEELEARIAIRSKYSNRYKKIYKMSDNERHKYINKAIKKYYLLRGWNYGLV